MTFFRAGLAVAIVAAPAFLAPAPASARPGPECARISAIAAEVRKVGRQRDRYPVADEAYRCPLYARQIELGRDMIKVLTGDPEFCGRNQRLVDRLQSSNVAFEATAGRLCGR